MKPNERLMANRGNQGEWLLFEVGNGPVNGWRNFNLRRVMPGAPKMLWQLGWNGDRLARNRSLSLLAEHHEDVLGWVCEVLDGGAA